MHHSHGTCHVAVVLMTVAAPAWAADYFWQNTGGGVFSNSANWSPPGGPGGAADILHFDLGVPVVSRYNVTDVSGQNRRLLVHNDSVRLTFSNAYTLVETDANNPSLSVGVSPGDQGSLLLAGTGPFTTEHTTLGLAAGSQGIVTVLAGTSWINKGNLRVGGAGTANLAVAGDVDVRQTLSIGPDSTVILTGGRIRLENYERQGTFNFVSGTIRLTSTQFEYFITTDPVITDLFGATPVVSASKALEMEGVPVIDTNMIIDGGTFVSLYGPGISFEDRQGSLTIINGGTATTPGGSIGGLTWYVAPTAPGSVTVSGTGSTWNTRGAGTGGQSLRIGEWGTGTLHILDGGTVVSPGGWVGLGADATVLISGEGSSWDMHDGGLILGQSSPHHGVLMVEDGASLTCGDAYVGFDANVSTGVRSVGEVMVRGTGSLWTILATENDATANHLRIGVRGIGTVTVAEGARIRVEDGKVILAESQGAAGTLVIGTPLGEEAGPPGILEASEIHGGAGTGGAELAFNHTGVYAFTLDRTLTGPPIMITGSTAVSLHGPGTVYFTAPQSYTGGTTIHNGMLVLRVNANIAGDIVNNARLVFQHDLGVLREVHGNISGTGEFFQTSVSNGIVRLLGNNTYTGGTWINQGTLQAGSAGALPQNTPYKLTGGRLDLNFNNLNLTMSRLEGTGGEITSVFGVLLIVHQEDDTEFGGTITGNVELHKRGAGRLTLSGINTPTVGTIVEGGTLRVNGQIVNPVAAVTVESGGTLDGRGSIATLHNTDGVVAPGDGIGTLTVTGNYTQDSSGTLRVELGGTGADESDRLQVNGTATLSGKLDVQLVDGYHPQIGDQFEIVTGGSVVGTFDPPPAPWSLEYGPTFVRLHVVAVAADFDLDSDVDDDDVAAFTACRTRDRVPHDGTPACEQADLDGDGDVDHNDFGILQRCYAGPDVLPTPGCAE